MRKLTKRQKKMLEYLKRVKKERLVIHYDHDTVIRDLIIRKGFTPCSISNYIRLKMGVFHEPHKRMIQKSLF